MALNNQHKLTRPKRQIMDIVFARGSGGFGGPGRHGGPARLLGRAGDPSIMEEKGHVHHEQQGAPAFAGAQGLDKILTEQNVRHTFGTTPGVHEWKVWRFSLNQFAPLLFN